MQDQDTQAPEDRSFPAFDRRRGPRRGGENGEAPVERREGDRRKRKPGIAGLFGAIFGRGHSDELS